MNRKLLEKLALGICVGVFVIAAWFWIGQIIDVNEMLDMARG
ncbi:MAG: hypothetical protein O3A63_11960 [Proteobacteria bacterium]|nr:hypothetical protein [Pseudomonadota bacterium]